MLHRQCVGTLKGSTALFSMEDNDECSVEKLWPFIASGTAAKADEERRPCGVSADLLVHYLDSRVSFHSRTS